MINPEEYDEPITVTLTVWLKDTSEETLAHIRAMDYVQNSRENSQWLENLSFSNDGTTSPIGLFEIDSIEKQ
tara:strand:+ start:281 stop:496 length:216 start_codon:yes stop_codon:yes gene_type:complete